MPQQPETTSTQFAEPPVTVSGEPLAPVPLSVPAPAPQRIPRWLERTELFLRVMLRLYIGLMVTCAPWAPSFWDQNPIFLRYSWLGNLAANGAVRGIVTGLGLLNLGIAFHDIIYRRRRD